MAIVMMTDAGTDELGQYDQVIRQLDEAGLGHPDGRLVHVTAAKENGSYFVVDIWESQEALDRFAMTLLPLIERAGGTPPAVQVSALHDLIVDHADLAGAATALSSRSS